LKSLVFHGKDDLRIEERPLPEIGDCEALLEVHAAAICGTDIRVKEFGHRCIPDGSSRILGHEMSGKVVEIGNGVNNLKVGDRVSVAPVAGCGYCKYCIESNATLCSENKILGLSLDGGFSQFMKIPQSHITGGNAFVLPEEIDYEIAAIAEPLATVFCGIEMCDVKPASIVCILGAGPIGLMHIILSKVFGAQKIIVSEMIEKRQEMARKFGADVVIDPKKQDVIEEVMANSYGRGADAVFVAVGSDKAQQQAIDLAAIGGYVNLFGTLPKGKEYVKINTNLIHYKNLKVLGMTGTTVKNYYRVLELLTSAKIDLRPLISRVFRLEEFEEAFEFAASTSSLKVLFKL